MIYIIITVTTTSSGGVDFKHHHLKQGLILPGVFILIMFIVTIIAIFYQWYFSTPNPITVSTTTATNQEPEKHFSEILCDSSTANFQYKAIFRVGCQTAKFDMKHGYIDFEILAKGDYPLGHPVR